MYIIQDKQGYAIHGYGQTEDEAWSMVVEGAGPFFDANGDPMSDESAYLEGFATYPATDALIKQVQEEGGAISWAVVRGVACTRSEAD